MMMRRDRELSQELPRWQCNLCGAKIRNLTKVCAECGSPSIRDVPGTDGEYDNVQPKTVEHLKKKISECWNQQKIGDEWITHPYVEKVVGVVNLSIGEFYEEVRCATCNSVYSKKNGRAVTPDDIVAVKTGKIPEASRREMWLGRNA